MLHMPREVGELTEVVRSVYNVCDSVACLAITSSLNTLFNSNSYDRIFSDMVATPLVDQRNSTGAHGEHASTTIKLIPRKGMSAQWEEQLSDILASLKLTTIVKETRPPTLNEVTAMAPNVPDELVAALHATATRIWWTEATKLYHIVRASIDISGVYEAKDLDHLKSFWAGDHRNGPALLKWATSFTDKGSVATQAKLMSEVMSLKLSTNANLDQFGQHCA